MQIIDEITLGLSANAVDVPYKGNPYLDTWEKNIAIVAPLEGFKGRFLKDWLRYFNAKIPIWQDKPPEEVKVGQEIGVQVFYQNLSLMPINMTAHISIYDPDDREIDSVEPEPVSVAVNGVNDAILTTIANKEGLFTAKSILYGDGIKLDEWSGPIAGEKPFPWHWLAIGLGALGAILLIPKKKKSKI